MHRHLPQKKPGPAEGGPHPQEKVSERLGLGLGLGLRLGLGLGVGVGVEKSEGESKCESDDW